MNDDNLLQRGAAAPAWTGRRQVLGRLARLATKELREILRDRRTIITLVVMPLLLYPLLAIVFQRFLLTSLSGDATVEYVLGVDSPQTWRQILQQIDEGDRVLLRRQTADSSRFESTDDDATPGQGLPTSGIAIQAEDSAQPKLLGAVLPASACQRSVVDATVHLAVVPRRAGGNGATGLDRPLTWDLFYRAGSPTSEAAHRFVETRLRAFSEARVDEQLKSLGVTALFPAPTSSHALDFSGAPVFSLAALIPLILVLMTITGAVYPAIDLTAGERERGTLEMLIAAPVPRVGLLLAKYVAVLTVALLTAVVNLTGMALTARSTGLGESLFGGALSFAVILKVLVLLGLFAAFFSAVLLAITSYARSFKEAQAYIIPLMLMCLVPGIVCLMPSLRFSSVLAVVPLVNIVLLARDLLEGSVDGRLAAAAVVSTGVYVVAAIAAAARIFGTDAILYGSQSTWSDIFRRPAAPQPSASVPAAAFALALIFPVYFLLGNELARSENMSMDARLVVCGLVTALVFAGIPLAVALFNRVTLASGMSLCWSGWSGFVAAALLGASLWPAAHELVLFAEKLGLLALRPDQLASAESLLQEWKHVSPWLILFVFAVLAGVCEELAFRGFFFASLRRVVSPWATILATAALFAALHEALAPGRLLPSAFLGLALGWVRYRSGSVLPSIVLHVLHNGLLVSIAYWRDDLMEHGIGIAETVHLPAAWLLAAAAGIAAGVALLKLTTGPGRVEGTR